MIGIIIQARMGSSRLPGKVLMPIGNKCLLEHILFRLSLHKRDDCQVIVATTVAENDHVIEELCNRHGVTCFRGSEQNVLGRYYECAVKHGFSDVVRLTADNPFVDAEAMNQLIDVHRKEKADYSYSFDVLPCGVGAEIFTIDALFRSLCHATKPNHFEHVNEYIQENPSQFAIASLCAKEATNHPEIRLTVDTLEDYKKACHIVEQCGDKYISTEEAIRICLQYA